MGEALIAQELKKVPNPRVKQITTHHLDEIKNETRFSFLIFLIIES